MRHHGSVKQSEISVLRVPCAFCGAKRWDPCFTREREGERSRELDAPHAVRVKAEHRLARWES